ncbi:MAG: transposase [Alphaproteobacteria bacterium]|nr:transposase [Alphaproteobacteria bacterium]
MSKYFREPDRRQRALLPVDMMDWLPEGDIVHLIVDAVSLMDLSAFRKEYKVGKAGNAPFEPRLLLSLLIYAYSIGVRSSRGIERLCWRDAGFRFIVGDQIPDHTVIARFRKRHVGDMETLFVEVLKLCRDAGLVKLGVVALDGTKIKANASLEANRTAKTIEEEVAAMLTEAAAVDAKEDSLFGAQRGDELPKALVKANDRKARLMECKKKLEAKAAAVAARQQDKIEARAAEEQATGRRKRGRKPKPADATVDPDTVANVTDPDSEMMKTRRGFVQGYNAQAVVTENQIILAADVTTQANDIHQLEPMLNQAQAVVETVMGEDTTLGASLADAGYCSEANLATETEDRELLIATKKDHKQRAAQRAAKPPRGRKPKNMTARERMDRKLATKRGRKLYRLRGQTVEPVFGQMKGGQSADHFSMRGLEPCRGEWKLQAAVHNLRKLHRDSVRKAENARKMAK